MQEEEIIQKVQEGDLQAFEELFERYKVSALRTIYLITKNQAMSEDILQEAFIICYTKIKTLKNKAYFKTWFYKILTHTAWRYMKKEGRCIPTEDVVTLAEVQSKDDWENDSRQHMIGHAMEQAIGRLEPKLQTVIILYYYNDFSVKEIAKIIGCFEGTVKSRLYTARKQLKVCWVEENQSECREDLHYEVR